MATEVCAEMVANVVTLVVGAGDSVAAGDTLLILESMKMEIPVQAPANGTVVRLFCREGGQVSAGQDLAVLVED